MVPGATENSSGEFKKELQVAIKSVISRICFIDFWVFLGWGNHCVELIQLSVSQKKRQ